MDLQSQLRQDHGAALDLVVQLPDLAQDRIAVQEEAQSEVVVEAAVDPPVLGLSRLHRVEVTAMQVESLEMPVVHPLLLQIPVKENVDLKQKREKFLPSWQLI